MSTVHLEAQVSADELMRAVEQLTPGELESLLARVLAVRAQRQAPCLPADEAALLARINQGMPEALRVRYQELIAKRRAETLTPAEHAELLRLTGEVENLEASRVQMLTHLAQLRHTTLEALLKDLGMQAPAHE
jgi:hypothetical protein